MKRTSMVIVILGSALVALAWISFASPDEARPVDRPAEAWWNDAVQRLADDDLAEAVWRVERAAIAGGAAFQDRREFLLGNVAYRRAEKAEALAALPEAGPPALDAAILEAERAARHWLAAARSRDDWPTARRNAQRALEKIVLLEKKRELMREKARKEGKEKQAPEEEPKDDGRTIEEELPVEIESGELGAAALERLEERLAEREREKLALRRKRLQERGAAGGRDW